jgi:hypothetical protein
MVRLFSAEEFLVLGLQRAGFKNRQQKGVISKVGNLKRGIVRAKAGNFKSG